jgi:hypothetical protein
LTIRKISFLICLLSTLTLFSNSHTRKYEVFFPSGSSFVSTDIQEQVVRIYNQIPELQYISVSCKGTDDKLATKAQHQLLARERAKKIQQVFLLFGLPQKHVQMSYGTVPIVIVFKPKAILKLTSLITSQVNDYKIQHKVAADRGSHLTSNQNNIYVFAAYSFETEEGVVVKEGAVDIDLVELANNDQVVKCGVVGGENGSVEEYGMYLNVEASQHGQRLTLREGFVFKVIVNAEMVPHDMILYEGNVIDRVMTWRKNKYGKVKENFLSDQEISVSLSSSSINNSVVIKGGFKTELTLNKLGWSKCAREVNPSQYKKHMLSLASETNYIIYLVSSTTKMIIPAFANLNFKDLYEFSNVPINDTFQLVSIPLDEKSKSYIFQSEINSSAKLLTPEVSHCAYGSVQKCVHIK